MKRYFEKISYNQFKKDIGDNNELYNKYNTPKRKTALSAGYDFEVVTDFTIMPGEIKKIPTGIKSQMQDSEVLMIFIRSSVGFKYNIRLTNQTGIIDSDYYNNIDNEGHIWVSLQNEGNEEKTFKQGEFIVQGIFVKYLLTDDDESNEKRIGGFGSTNKEETK